MSLLECIVLAASACAAGFINSIAGGGTLLTFPALLFFGTAPVQANATSTVSLVVGTAGSIVAFRKHLVEVRAWLVRFVPVSVLGGWLGSVLLTRTTDQVFAHLVPFLILFATVLFFLQSLFRRWFAQASASKHSVWIAVAFQFAVSIYGGYFGAGIGILMLASLGFIGLSDIHQMNALKNLLGSIINVVASLWFIASGIVHWPKACVMIVGALAGYYLGARVSLRVPQAVVRRIITIIGVVISAVMFYRQFVAGAH